MSPSQRVTADLIAEALGQTKQNIGQRAKKEKWVSETKRGRGGRIKMYPLLPLPEAVRTPVLALLARQEAVTAAAQTAGVVTGAKLNIRAAIDGKAAAATRQLGMVKFDGLPEQNKRRGHARAAIVELAAGYVKMSGSMGKKRAETYFCDGYNSGEIEVPAWIRDELSSCSPGSLDNWRNAIKAEGLTGVSGKYGLHRLGSGVIDSNAPMNAFIRGMLVEYPHATPGAVMDGLKVRFEPEELPNIRTLQRWIIKWQADNEQLLLAISNPDAWRSKFQSASGSLSASILRLNQRWETDSTKGDLLLADGKRHNIVGVIDVYSRRLRLYVSRTSSATAVASCLRRAMLDWGVPEQLGTDNGSDFVSLYIRRIVLGLGIDQDIAPPFTPEHKPFIERSFGTFCRDLVELLGGYIGHDVNDRKAIESRKSFAQRLFKGGLGDDPLELRKTPEQLQEFCDQWTDDRYGREIHSALGCSPAQKAASWTQPIQIIENERALDLMLAPAPGAGSAGGDGIRTVQKKGIKIDNAWFDAAELGGQEGRQVRVLLDEADIGEVFVFTMDNTFIAKAICTERLGISHRDLAIARKRHQREAINEGKKLTKALRKEANTTDIAFEILQQAALDAGNVVFLPNTSVPHTTETLREAAIAAEHAVDDPSHVHVHMRAREGDNITVLPVTGGRPNFGTSEEKVSWLAANLSEVTALDRGWVQEECRRSRWFKSEFAGLISQIEEAEQSSATG